MKCSLWNRCGACTNINGDYQEELLNKEESVRKLFPRHKVSPIRGMEDPYHYRHKIYAAFAYNRNEKLIAGTYAEDSHKVIHTTDCLIQNETGNAIIRDFTEIAGKMHIEPYNEDRHTGVLRHLYLRISHASGDVLMVIVIGSKVLPGSNELIKKIRAAHPEIRTIILNFNSLNTSMILGKREKILYGPGYITDEIDGLTFRISSRSFFQVNPVQTEILYKTALDLAELKKKDTVLDACCGTGTISLLAARRCAQVTGMEIVPEAIKDAIVNAKANSISNARFYCDDAEHFMLNMKEAPDVVFLDPPRSGFTRPFVSALTKLKPKKIIYVSCNPKTQARDTAQMEREGYQILKIIPVDMFPHTDHVETVCCLYHQKKDFISVPYEPENGEYLKQLK